MNSRAEILCEPGGLFVLFVFRSFSADESLCGHRRVLPRLSSRRRRPAGFPSCSSRPGLDEVNRRSLDLLQPAPAVEGDRADDVLLRVLAVGDRNVHLGQERSRADRVDRDVPRRAPGPARGSSARPPLARSVRRRFASPTIPSVLATFTIRPSPPAQRGTSCAGRPPATPGHRPSTLMSWTCLKCSYDSSSIGPRMLIPALLIRMSIAPNRSRVAATTRDRRPPADVTSAPSPSVFVPRSVWMRSVVPRGFLFLAAQDDDVRSGRGETVRHRFARDPGSTPVTRAVRPVRSNSSLRQHRRFSSGGWGKAVVSRSIRGRRASCGHGEAPTSQANRVQGTLVGSAEGQRLFARRRPGRREMSEGVRVQARTTCRMPPHQPAGSAKPAVWFGGVLDAGSTKGSSVACHGSS